MTTLNLDSASAAVQEFMRNLPRDPEGVELTLDGKLICRILPVTIRSEVEKEAILERGWQLIRQAQERNANVPNHIIEREVNEAVAAVRGA